MSSCVHKGIKPRRR